MRTAQSRPAPRLASHGTAHSVRPTIEREAQTADRLLRAFTRARTLAVRARQGKDARMAAELDRLAWSLVDTADPVRVRYAQRRLDVSDPTARAWLDRGILEGAGASPRRVTLESLARVEEIARELRNNDQRRDLTAAIERHVRWERMRQSPGFKQGLQRIRETRQGAAHDHRTAERRSLAFHRRVAQHLDRPTVAMARQRVDRWLREKGPVPPVWAEQWATLLAAPLPDLEKAITQDSDKMRELRQNTPFAGALTEADRMRVISETH